MLLERCAVAQIDDLYAAWAQALAQRDANGLARLLAPEWLGVDTIGRVIGAESYVSSLERSPNAGRRIEVGGLTCHPFLDASALVARGRVRIDVRADGSAPLELQFTDLWVWLDDVPRCVLHHESRLDAGGLWAVHRAAAGAPPDDPSHELRGTGATSALEEIRGTYDRIHAALPAQDVETLALLLDDEWATTDMAGVVRTKSEYFDFVRDDLGPEYRFELHDLHARAFGKVAASVCRFAGTGPVDGGAEATTHVRVTGAWIRRDGGWRYVAQQGSFVVDTDGADP